MKNIIILFFAAAACSVFASGGSEETFTVYYTASLNGNIDGCDCSSSPKAGLVKTAKYLKSIDRSNSILLDAGDMSDVYNDHLLHTYISQVYNSIGYNAAAIGDQEFSQGFDFLIKSPLPYVSSNLKFRGSEKYPEFIQLEFDTVTVDIFSVIDEKIFYFYPDEITDELTITDPATYLKKFLHRDNLNIIIFHGSIENAKLLAEKVSNIDLLILGHEQMLIDGEIVNGTVIVSPGENGNRVGKLVLKIKNNKIVSFENSFVLFSYKEDIDDPDVRDLINEYFETLKPKVSK